MFKIIQFTGNVAVIEQATLFMYRRQYFMKNKKTDHRSKYTQMVVKQALLKLLAEKPLNKIGVSELCLSAEVGRGTFYNHFYDVYDVYESTENDFYDEIKTKLENIKSHDIDRPFFKEIMLLIYKNADLARLIVNNKNNSDLLKRIIEFVRNKFIEEWSETFKGHSLGFFNNVFSYITNGSIGIIADWIYSDMRDSLDEIAVIIAELNELVINTYLKS